MMSKAMVIQVAVHQRRKPHDLRPHAALGQCDHGILRIDPRAGRQCAEFGRARQAQQPSLSRQIRRLEQHLGVRLLLPHRRGPAAQPSRITIGNTTGLIVTPAVRELRREHPDANVQVSHLDWDQSRDALLDHRVDAVVTRLPFPTEKLHVTILYDEPRALAVSIDHRLAGRTQ
jgi:DNA-binding transcriptional LysR family regulator